LKDPESFKTSAVSPEECLEAYREASQQTKEILCITISAKLSAVYNVAQQTREQAKTELPQTSIEVLDSQTVTAAEGFVALAAALLLDTIRHVYRSGRIPKVAAQVGSMLNIRPILTISGVVHFAGAVRSREHGIDRILQMMRDKVGQNPAHVAVMHAYAPDEAERLMERVSAEFNCAELWLTEFSPVMGYACGTGTLGLAFYSEG
jgi:fatty acid-binding protein DegV